MSLIEKEVSKYKSIELITLVEFYKIWEFNENSKIAILENGTEKPIYLGNAINTPIVLAERRILHFNYDEDKTPIIILTKPEEKVTDIEYSLWRKWMYGKKLF